MMANGFTNLDQWNTAIREAELAAGQAVREALPEVGAFARDAIRNRIPPGSDSSRFPGYASTGVLHNSIVASEVLGGSLRPKIIIGLSRSASTLTKIKAYVHEYGMTIHAKRFKYMTFKIGNRWVKAQSVRIRPKYFFRDGWAEAQQKFPEIVETSLRKRWPPRK